MYQTPAQILTQVLEIIEYENDKQEFIHKFLDACVSQTIDKLIDSLSENKQKELNEKISQEGSNIRQTFYSYFGEEQYYQSLGKISQQIFAEYIELLSENLPSDKKSKLEEYLKSLNS